MKLWKTGMWLAAFATFFGRVVLAESVCTSYWPWGGCAHWTEVSHTSDGGGSGGGLLPGQIPQMARIRNAWQSRSDSYINVETSLQCSPALNGQQSSWWTLERVQNYNIYRIRNVWQNDKYLHIQNGSLEFGQIEDGWQSAWWTFEPMGSVYRIRNYWKNDIYLNVQNGDLEAGPIDFGWASALWLLELVN